MGNGAESGKITGKIRERYRSLADGGAGMIITGMHGVSAAGTVAGKPARPRAMTISMCVK